ncbi:MAG: YfiR family protein [Verrucomicrobia bacterium]|nr:YfiR family protein [Verrucomicrobiota bacterium]
MENDSCERAKPASFLPPALLLGLLVRIAALPASGQATSREYDLKAAFLYNFATFGEWPAAAFAHEGSPFVIGVLGADPFGAALRDIVAGERAKGRPIVIRHFDRAVEARGCHILFISASETPRHREILALFRDQPVLTVGDVPGFAEEGGRVGFVTASRVGIQVNPVALRAGNLAISPKLLRLADLVAVDIPSP